MVLCIRSGTGCGRGLSPGHRPKTKDEETAVTTFREYIMSDKMSNARQSKILKTWDVPQRIIRKMEGKREHFYLSADKALEFHFATKMITNIEKPWEL